MKYQQIIYLLSILIWTSCHNPNQQLGKIQPTKQAAKVFSLSVIETYFSEDCDKLFGMMNDSILIMDGDGVFAIAGKQDKLCKSMNRAIRDREKTMADYLETYKAEILTRTELEKKYDRKLPDYYKTIASDFFFLGFELKEGKTAEDNFIWDDMFVFMVRYENGSWHVKGVGG